MRILFYCIGIREKANLYNIHTDLHKYYKIMKKEEKSKTVLMI